MGSFARLVDLLGLLQGGPSHTGDELASRLGVTLRTLRRDIDRLRDAGFVIEATPGRYGGYRLAGGAAMAPLVLSDEEALATAIALRGTAVATVAGLDPIVLGEALAKLERLLPPRLRGRVTDLREATVSLLRSPPAPAEAAIVTLLARGCRGGFQVELSYTNRQGTCSRRRLEPYRLVQTSHCWYLVAHDLEVGTWRAFRVDRIADAALTTIPAHCDNPPDPVRLVTEAMAAVAAYPHRARLRLPVPADVARTVIPGSYGVIDPLDAGGSVVTIGFANERWLLSLLAELPWDVEVLEPDSLRQALAELGHRLVTQHATSASATEPWPAESR